MADFAGGRIQGFVGPTELGAADNLKDVIVAFIRSSGGTRRRCARDRFGADRTGDPGCALARPFGPRVPRTLLPADRLDPNEIDDVGSGPERLEKQWVESRPSAEFRTNRDILAAFLRSDIEVHSDFNQEIFHQKFVIRDYRGTSKPASALLTGSANFTSTDTPRGRAGEGVVRSGPHARARDHEADQQVRAPRTSPYGLRSILRRSVLRPRLSPGRRRMCFEERPMRWAHKRPLIETS